MWEDDVLYNEYLRGQIDTMEVLLQAIKDRYVSEENPSAMILNLILDDLYREVSKNIKLS